MGLKFKAGQTNSAIIKSKSAPVLEANEKIEFEGKIGNAFWIMAGIISIFIPPFVTGLIAIAYIVRCNRRSGIWITSTRFIHFQWFLGSYRIFAIPFDRIVDIKREKMDVLSDDGAGLLQRMFHENTLDLAYLNSNGNPAKWKIEGVKYDKALTTYIKQRQQQKSNVPGQSAV